MTPAEAIALLGHWDAGARERAMAALAQGGEASVPALIAALDHPNPTLRGHAALCLGQLGARTALLPLAEKVGSWPAGDDRTYCVRALADIVSAELHDDLALGDFFAALMRDRDHFVRALACRALGKLTNPRARKVLVRAGRDAEPWVREAAASALGNLVDPQRVSPSPVAEPPAPAEPPATTDGESEGVTADPNAAVASSATVGEFLSQLSLTIEAPQPAETDTPPAPPAPVEPSRVQDAIERLFARTSTTRELAAHDLEVMGSAAAPALEQALATRDALPPLEAVVLLGRLGGATGVAVAEGLARRADATPDLRAVAYRALAQLATGSERGVLDGLLGEPSPLRSADPFVRAAAAAALGPFRTVRAARALIGLIDDVHPLVREEAARALGRAAVPGIPDLPAVLTAAAKKERDEPTQRAIVEGLTSALRAGAIGADAAARCAQELLPRAKGALRVAVLLLLAAAERPGIEGAEAVLDSLGELDRQMVLAACAAAGKVAPAGYGPLVERLTVLAGAADREISRAAILSLGEVGGPVAAATLRQLRSDGDPEVADAARTALTHLPTFDSEIFPLRGNR